MMPPRRGDLEIEEDHGFQRKEWVAQRIAWSLMALCVLAALLGLLGSPGPLSTATRVGGGAAPLRLTLDRFGHYRSPSALRIDLVADTEGETRLRLARAYLDAVEVERVMPQPDRVQLGPEDVVFVFDVLRPGPLSITFHVTFERIGRLAGHVVRPGGDPVAFSQLVYP